MLYKIIIGLAGFMVIIGGLFGWLVVRMVRGYDCQLKDIYCKIEDLPAIREAITWLKEKNNVG